MGEVHWKPKENLEPIIRTCDCGETYWTQVKVSNICIPYRMLIGGGSGWI